VRETNVAAQMVRRHNAAKARSGLRLNCYGSLPMPRCNSRLVLIWLPRKALGPAHRWDSEGTHMARRTRLHSRLHSNGFVFKRLNAYLYLRLSAQNGFVSYFYVFSAPPCGRLRPFKHFRNPAAFRPRYNKTKLAGWRNWQTQTAQNRPTARSWGFKSLARYQPDPRASSAPATQKAPSPRSSVGSPPLQTIRAPTIRVPA
jgi:hypothetical protein